MQDGIEGREEESGRAPARKDALQTKLSGLCALIVSVYTILAVAGLAVYNPFGLVKR
jgi:hypothetical protein